MSDRELLEAAARAAGMEGWTWKDSWGCMKSPPRKSPHGLTHAFWNPLEDDGEALRLAVKMSMHCVDAFPVPSMALIKECGGDEYAATRRAIVRAAAQLGEEQ